MNKKAEEKEGETKDGRRRRTLGRAGEEGKEPAAARKNTAVIFGIFIGIILKYRLS